MEMKRLFSIAPDTRTGGEVMGVFLIEPDARTGGEVVGVFLVIGCWLRQHRTLAQRPT
jgi:hypothetical protein